jgi:hypothetical protein
MECEKMVSEMIIGAIIAFAFIGIPIGIIIGVVAILMFWALGLFG